MISRFLADIDRLLQATGFASLACLRGKDTYLRRHRTICDVSVLPSGLSTGIWTWVPSPVEIVVSTVVDDGTDRCDLDTAAAKGRLVSAVVARLPSIRMAH